MWQVWRKATTFHLLPSQVLRENDPLAAWSLDNLVLTFGTIVENALLERDEIGSGQHKQSVSRYTLTQLLDPAFTLPRPVSETDELESYGPVAGLIMDEVT
jgi:hypothetical protein